MTLIRRSVALRLTLGLLVCPLPGVAGAQQPTQAQRDAIKQSCRGDYQSYCASVPSGGQASLQCLQGHMSNLSSDCQSAVGALSGGAAAPSGAASATAMPPAGASPKMSPRQEAAMMRNACGSDFRAYCRGVSPGGGRGLSCLAENQSRLSPPCRSALAEMRGSR